MDKHIEELLRQAFNAGFDVSAISETRDDEKRFLSDFIDGMSGIADRSVAEIEAAAVERFVKERFWNSSCEVSACVAESGIQWAANRRKEVSK